MTAAALMTVEQFEAYPGDYELVEGELAELSSASFIHARVRRRLEIALGIYLAEGTSGEVVAEVDCRTGEASVRRPDLSIYLPDRLKGVDLTKLPMPVPDIAVEILSPSEAAISVQRKALEYLAAGCQEVWLIDPENREIHVRMRDGGSRIATAGGVIETPLLVGFSARVADLLAGL